jgi:hypothetical protein
VSSKAYKILAAVLFTVAAIFTTAAIFPTSPTDARNLGILAGVTAVVGGIAWIIAAIKG